MLINKPLIISGTSTTPAFTINQSIRFNEADNSYMHRTPSSSSNQRTWTWSGWLKHTMQSTNGYHNIWTVRSGASDFFEIAKRVTATGDNHMDITNMTSGTRDIRLITNRQFRDPSAWYHFVFVSDTTKTLSTERFRMYVNGQRETSFSTETYPSLNLDTFINTTNKHEIGAFNGGSGYMMDGYMAEITFIDGQALDPSSFGEYNSSNIWIPKDVSGLTFGTNGFHIDGRDSADLGDDESGNGNDFTTSGLGAHDQVADSPSNNFATINPIYADQTGANNLTLTEGNLEVAGTSSAFDLKGFTFNLPKSGKWYFEYTIGGSYDGFGFCVVGEEGTITPGGNGLGQLSVAQGGGIQQDGWRNGGSLTVNFGSTFTSGHIHQVAIDVDNGKWYYGIQNTYYANDGGTDGNPSAGTNHTTTFDFAGNDVVLMTQQTTASNAEHWNFGQNGTFNGTKTAQGNSDANGVGNFYYAPPTGYLALCTKNLGS